MHYNYFLSDTHFCHANIIKFTGDNGELIRPGFSCIEEHDEYIINNINKKVRIQDKLYLLGDVAFKAPNLKVLERINTKKLILIKGNHDILDLSQYVKYFRDIRAYKMMPKEGIIFSHIPVHPNNFSNRFKWNVHGHTHQRNYDDKRYFNISCENINYNPLELEEILTILKVR